MGSEMCIRDRIEEMVQKKLEEKNSSPDFLTVIGMITYEPPAQSA